jgi:chemotaxis protein histidine kinase CheA
MVDLMGGTISVVSSLGKGTTFTVKSISTLKAIPNDGQKTNAPVSPVKDYSSLKNAHILLFEDHPLNQEIVKALARKQGRDR